jgi:hypothetical protein
MRLLGATSQDVRGSLTEAGETVGEITVDGTLGLVLFAGVPAGLFSGALYAVVRPLLPRGYAGGVALGALLIVLVGPRIDPLRSDNFDFVILGPAWLAVLGFSVLALFHGMLVVALANRMSDGTPALTPRAKRAGRIGAVAVLLLALPAFATAVAEIL